MTKQNLNLIKQMTKDYEPTGQKPIKTNKASFRESMIQCCYELAHTEEQMQILQRTNPQMYEYIRERFPKEQIDPERENFVYFPKKEKEREVMNMDQEETIDERYCFDDEDILSIADSLGFTIPDESIEPMKRKFNSLWKDKTKETNEKQLEKQCKEDNGLSLKMFLFCEEYLKTGNIQKTCSNLGIGRTTGFNYLKEKEVDEYLKKRRETIRKETEEMISSNYQKAMEGLSDLMEDSTFKSDEIRIKAIDIFLKYHNKSIKEGSESE